MQVFKSWFHRKQQQPQQVSQVATTQNNHENKKNAEVITNINEKPEDIINRLAKEAKNNSIDINNTGDNAHILGLLSTSLSEIFNQFPDLKSSERQIASNIKSIITKKHMPKYKTPLMISLTFHHNSNNVRLSFSLNEFLSFIIHNIIKTVEDNPIATDLDKQTQSKNITKVIPTTLVNTPSYKIILTFLQGMWPILWKTQQNGDIPDLCKLIMHRLCYELKMPYQHFIDQINQVLIEKFHQLTENQHVSVNNKTLDKITRFEYNVIFSKLSEIPKDGPVFLDDIYRTLYSIIQKEIDSIKKKYVDAGFWAWVAGLTLGGGAVCTGIYKNTDNTSSLNPIIKDNIEDSNTIGVEVFDTESFDGTSLSGGESIAGFGEDQKDEPQQIEEHEVMFGEE